MGAIALEDRKNFIKRMKELPYRGARDSFYLIDGAVYNGEVPDSSFDRVCYGGIKHYYKSVEKLFVFHLPIKDMSEHWTSYVLNKGIYKEAFHTKSLERGYKYGFKINCDFPFNVVLGAMITLRETFNVEQAKAFDMGIKAGFSEEDMIYFLSRFNIYVKGGHSLFYAREWDSDHHHISFHTTYGDFIKGPKEGWKKGTPVKIQYSGSRVVENYSASIVGAHNNREKIMMAKTLTGISGVPVTEKSIIELMPKVKEVFA